MISKQLISFNRITIINDSPKFGETVREVVSSYSKNIPPVLIEIERFDQNKEIKTYQIDRVSMDYSEPLREGCSTLKVTNSVIRISFLKRYTPVEVNHQEAVYAYSQIKRITLYYPY